MTNGPPVRSSLEARLLAAVGAGVRDGHERGGRVLVAYSGGLDSSVLLHALARAGTGLSIEAVHVDHGWHADSAEWSAHCVAEARALGVLCRVVRLAPDQERGRSREDVAREGRYRLFAQLLGPDDTLVTAHHGDDQLETLLLRLLRGSGVRGFRAIHGRGSLGAGRLARPLLDFSRAELAAVAAAWGIASLTDPANADLGFDRSYLRATIVPAIKARWPGAHRVAQRVARHMAAADELLDELAVLDADGIDDPARVPVEQFAGLNAGRQANLLRYLLRQGGLKPPPERRLLEILRAVAAVGCGQPQVGWAGGDARIYRGRLYLCTPPSSPARAGGAGEVRIGVPWRGPEGELRLVEDPGAAIPESWARAGLRVAFRQGGERFRPAGRAHHKTLKQWFQEQRIVPWMRARIPLLYRGDELIAIADLELADLPAADGGARYRPVWTDHSPVR